MKAGKNTTITFRLIYFGLFLVALALGLWHLFKPSTNSEHSQRIEPIKSKPNQFGFYSDSLVKVSSIVLNNQTLSSILTPLNIPNHLILDIIEKSKDIFDFRKIAAGRTYNTYFTPDSNNSVKYFVYEKNAADFVVVSFNDSISVYEGSKKVTVKINQCAANIDYSLYVALMDSNASPELAIKLSEVFAWQVDFYHLQKGDFFKVIFEEEFIAGEDGEENLVFIGIGKILGAYFNYNNKDYYAVPFIQDSVYQFFDEHGNSLRKAFLKSPLEFGRISSRFSRSRLHPVLKTHRPHLGVDYAAPIGTPVRTTGDGYVIDTGYSRGNGNYLKIKHNSVYTTMYLHLSKYAKSVRKGARVKQGQVIGYIGSTGLSTGPHLDYRFFVNGKPVDPLKVEVPPSHPVKTELKESYEKVKNEIIQKLDEIPVSRINKENEREI